MTKDEIAAPGLISSIRVHIKKIDDLLHDLAPTEPNADEAHGEIHELAYEFEQVVLSATSPGEGVREALEPFLKAARIIENRPQDYGDKRIAAFGGLADAHDLYPRHFMKLLRAIAPAEKAGDDAQARGNTFEHHPALAREIERMASTGNTGSLLDWQRFTDALNAALAATPTPPSADVADAPGDPAIAIPAKECLLTDDRDHVFVRASVVRALIQSAAPAVRRNLTIA
jgi:hypothetical protein